MSTPLPGRPRALVVGMWVHVPGHLARGSASALSQLGYEVAIHDPLGARDSLAFKLWNHARLRFPAVREAAAPAQNRGLLRVARAFHPDLVLVVRGEMVTESTILDLRDEGATVINWCPDDPFQAGTELVAAAAYDAVFVFDPHYIPILERAGAPSVHYLSMACDPEVHRPLTLTEAERIRYGADVVFVGSRYQNREEALARLTDFNLAIWGGGWKLPLARPGHPLRPFFRGVAMGGEMVKIYNASRVVINVQHPQSVHAQNMRTFEAPACGALTLTPYTRELPNLFDIGREIVEYRTPDELVEKARYYLAHLEEAAAIAARGQARAIRDHSYLARMRQVLAIAGAPGEKAAAA